ncbi:MAG: DegV family protein [Lachnospiraceae bacterium]|jgi:DegV family protein with EDD domain|nr:DegV family protein [Lachnospiraceae bacterium]
MNYKIIGDSCTDLTKELKNDPHIKIIPLTLIVDEHHLKDDENFNVHQFLKMMKESPNCPKSACPSPDDYMKEFIGEGDTYVVTLSSKLSGSYNSAELAKRLYLEENPDKNIGIIDSRSASAGQTLLTTKLRELIAEGLSFENVMQQINEFRDGMKTKFVIESLDTMRKNGRLSTLQALICNTLNIKPVMGGTPEGNVCKLDQARGIMRALVTMAKLIEKDVIKPHEKLLTIAHCNCYERALFLKDEILKRVPFKDYLIVETAGVSTMYANEGGIVTAY